MPQPSGGFLAKELAGPGNFEIWKATWEVFTTLMIKVKCISDTACNVYAQRIARLHSLWGDGVWHLIYEADDLLRHEGLDQIRWRVERTIEAGEAPPAGGPPRR